MSGLLYIVLSQCFINYAFLHFSGMEMRTQPGKTIKNLTLIYLLEETFSHYFYNFLRPQAKKKRFFLKTLSRKQESHNFFCKNQGGGAKDFVKSIASRLVSGKYL